MLGKARRGSIPRLDTTTLQQGEATMTTTNPSLHDFMVATPQSLAKQQHDLLLAHTLSVLDRARDAIKCGKYDDVDTFYSGSGDGYGSDNDCLQFSYTEGENKDILMTLNKLKELHDIAYPKKTTAGTKKS